MAKKMESTGGTFGKRATAASWFKARVKVSVESMGSSYACERDVPLEAPDRLSSSYFVQVDILTSSSILSFDFESLVPFLVLAWSSCCSITS